MANDLEGKVFLLTGATEGIGKAAAKAFAARGATVAIVGRNAEKTAAVKAGLEAAGGAGRVESYLGDLSRIADVRRIAAEFRAKHDRLDVLVNNAGAVFQEYRTSPDGIELTFALNHLAYFVLTTELLDLLRKTPGSRVVSTSSGGHHAGRIDLDDIAHRRRKDAGFRAYCDSKLANVLFTRELARRGVHANSFHPGFVATGFALNNAGLLAKVLKVVGPKIGRTPEKGAETLIWLATSPEAARFNGEYFHDRKLSRTSSRAKDDLVAAKLWELSEKLAAGA